MTGCTDSSSCFWLLSARFRERRRWRRTKNHIQLPTASNGRATATTRIPIFIASTGDEVEETEVDDVRTGSSVLMPVEVTKTGKELVIEKLDCPEVVVRVSTLYEVRVVVKGTRRSELMTELVIAARWISELVDPTLMRVSFDGVALGLTIMAAVVLPCMIVWLLPWWCVGFPEVNGSSATTIEMTIVVSTMVFTECSQQSEE